MKSVYQKKWHSISALLYACMLLLLYSCQESSGPGLSNAGDSVPGPVGEVQVQNIPGGAHISYTLPEDEDMLYVEAVYSTEFNGQQEVKSSYYNDNLTVKGFADTSSKEVELYTYSRGGNKSEVQTVTIQPLKPPFQEVFESISMENDFGGISLAYSNNETEDDLTIAVVNDTLGEVLSVQNNYIDQREGAFNIHGLEPKTYKLGYFVSDEYQNQSDTLYQNLTPLFEQELPKDLFSNAHFPTDAGEHPRYGSFEGIYDDASEYNRSSSTNFTSPNVETLPVWITIDLGQKAKISRITFYGLEHWSLYTNDYPREFELWGSADPNINDGEAFDDSWFKYGTFETKPESETGIDQETPYPQNGINYQIPEASTFPYAQYFRIVVTSTYSGDKQMAIGELDIYGAPQNATE